MVEFVTTGLAKLQGFASHLELHPNMSVLENNNERPESRRLAGLLLYYVDYVYYFSDSSFPCQLH